MSGGTFGFKGFKDRALEFPAGVVGALAVAVSPLGRARLRYNDTAKQLEQSIDGGAYTPLGGTGAGPWDQVGTNVFPDSTGWNVIIGAAATVGTEKLRVVGDVLVEGHQRIEENVGLQAFLEFDDGSNSPVSSAGEGRIRFDASTNQFQVSENGGAWTPIGGGGSGWTDDGGTVRLTTATDDVAIGIATMVGSEKLRVVGDVSIQGDIIYEPGAARDIKITQAADDTTGDDLSFDAGQGGNFSAGPVGVGGQLIASAGAGGTDASPAGTGGVGGTGNFRGGAGGSAPDGGGTGGTGGAVIVEGGVGGSSGGTQGGGGGATLRGGSGSPGGTSFVQGGPGAGVGDAGGNVFIDGGAPGGGGAGGSVNLGASNTSSINLAGGGGVPINIGGAADLIGHFGVTAVVQPSTTGTILGHTPGALVPVTEDSTFTGNTGITAYTIGDVILALKQLGLLAL